MLGPSEGRSRGAENFVVIELTYRERIFSLKSSSSNSYLACCLAVLRAMLSRNQLCFTSPKRVLRRLLPLPPMKIIKA